MKPGKSLGNKTILWSSYWGITIHFDTKIKSWYKIYFMYICGVAPIPSWHILSDMSQRWLSYSVFVLISLHLIGWLFFLCKCCWFWNTIQQNKCNTSNTTTNIDNYKYRQLHTLLVWWILNDLQSPRIGRQHHNVEFYQKQ